MAQIAAAVDKGLQDHEFEYGIYGSVIYSNSWINADGPGTRSAFYKESAYSYQKEWRLCLLQNALVDKPYKFYIGDLTDITEVISLNEFLTHPEKPYRGYSSTSNNIKEENDSFHIFGTIDAVNHLMFSYMTPSANTPTRSDQAQADWHYIKYLQLNGSHKEIDSYLDARMRECRDIDHMELLVQYRLSVGEWVKATDAFMFIKTEAPCVISKDPARFFFPLHTILMQHKEAADAGKLYKIATKEYDLPDDIKRAMQSDVIFALGFYDQSISLFQKMKGDSSDPILDYYLAVSYLHVLDFEKAHQHLSIFEQLFSHSPQSANNTSYLRTLINCFRNKEQLIIDERSQVFEQLNWQAQWEQLLVETQKKEAFLGIDVLYGVEKAQKWKLLNKFQTITICPLTIAEMIDAYMQSGDPIFFNIIINLSCLPQVEVKSPELDYYLALDISRSDLPPYMKMEKAFHLQEMQNK